MTAVNAYKEHQCNCIDFGKDEKLLKVAAIYGANASGKSNLFFAMKGFQNIIKRSLDGVGDDEETAIAKYYVPFLFVSKRENIGW